MINGSVNPSSEGAEGRPSPLWRLGALLLPLLGLLLIPPPDRDLPPWASLLAVLGASRIPVLRERLAGLEDLEASLPFLALAAAALFRFSPAQAPGALAEALASLLLLALLGRLGGGQRRPGRWTLVALELPALGLLSFAWALFPPLATAGLLLILVLAFATAPRGRRQA